MKVLSNTLKVEWDQWDDPGDYPSNAGAGPLPSYKFPIIPFNNSGITEIGVFANKSFVNNKYKKI